MSSAINDLKRQIRADCFRYVGSCHLRDMVRLTRTSPGFRYTLVLRLATHLRTKRGPLAILTRALHRHHSIKFGIQIPLTVKVGAGLLLPHFGGIVINSKAKIGENCTILHGVTLGSVAEGRGAGHPELCDGVYVGPGAAVVGRAVIGSGAVLAAGTWVNFNVPDNSLVIGNPGRIVKVYENAADARVRNYVSGP